jgi:hypothetical protein
LVHHPQEGSARAALLGALLALRLEALRATGKPPYALGQAPGPPLNAAFLHAMVALALMRARSHPTTKSLAGVLLAAVLAPGPAAVLAQEPPPGHDTAVSAPLFVQDLPIGTISVRITRPSMTEPITGAEVTGTWTDKAGKPVAAKVKTAEDGRAIFSAVPAGSTFVATAEVDGESLTSARFPVPAEGGTRLLMIVGARAAEALGEMAGHPPHGTGAGPKPLALRSGKVETRDGLPAGTVEIRVLLPDGKPLAGARVDLGHVQHMSDAVDFEHKTTDDAGLARFSGLQASEGQHWAAVVMHDSVRIGTSAFSLESRRGAAGELHIPARTSDASVLRVSSGSRLMVELREEGITVMQNLIVENTSDKIFVPGPRGLIIPLPQGFTAAEKLPGGTEVEIKEGVGAVLHEPILPGDGSETAAQVRTACVLGTHEAPEVEVVQPMPLGLLGGTVMVPETYSVGLSAPGLRARPAERDDNGNTLRMYDLDSVAPGQALRLVVYGLPTRSHTGQWIAGLLAGLVVVGGVVAARRPRKTASGESAG